MTLQEWAALGGIVFGASALTLSMVTYLRDRPSVRVSLTWDMTIVGGMAEQSAALVRIENPGKRTVFVSHASLRLPSGGKILILKDTIAGKTLPEGSPPWGVPVPYDAELLSTLRPFAPKWRNVRAVVEGSNGRKWRSRKHSRRSKPPSWARADK